MNPLNKAVDLGCVVRLGKVFFNLEEVSFVFYNTKNFKNENKSIYDGYVNSYGLYYTINDDNIYCIAF